MTPHFLSLDEVLRIHREAINTYGGSHGVRDSGMLESALAAPQNLLAYGQADSESAQGIALLAAAYWFHISMNHPFIDGNKRTSFMCCVAFLNLNGWDLDIDYEIGLDLSIKLTTHAIERSELAAELVSRLVAL